MIYFLIPTYNEALNIPHLYQALSSIKHPEPITYVFSDDGSTDTTQEQIKHHFKNDSFTLLGDGVNRGPGYAFNVGFEWVLKQNPAKDDLVVTIEADGTSDLSILPAMLSLQKHGFNLVLASVYAQGGGFDKTSWLRKLVSSVANLLFRFLFDLKVLTLSSFYRVYRVELLQKIKSEKEILIQEPGFICMLEILVKAIACEAKIIEVPMILHSQKRIGKSKLKLIKTSLAYFRFLFFRNRSSKSK